jgi:glycosyltransferase involved in cell wall biosynthesis
LKAKLAAIQGARSVKRIILPSQHKVRDWASTFPFIRNVTRIANPVAEPPIMTKTEARKQLGLPIGDAKILGFVGLFRPEKGLLTAMKALRSLNRPDLALVVAGAGPEDEQMRAFAREHNLSVHFMGYMYDPSAVYRASDIFLFPSTFDNFPIALMQAARCDVPIVASDIQIVHDEFSATPNVRRVEPGSVESLAKAIDKLADELPIQNVGLAEVVRQMCDPAKVAQRYIDVFDGRA